MFAKRSPVFRRSFPLLMASTLALGLGACSRGAAQTTTPPSAVAARAPAPAPAELPKPEPSILDLESAFERAAAAIGPSVVSVINEHEARSRGPLWSRPNGGSGEGRGLGSGVIIDPRGYILTNNHVVDGARVLKVRLHDDREVRAELVGTDPKTDLAVIRIEAEGLQAAVLHEGADLRVGQWVLAVGSPFGLRSTVTAGIVSAVGRGSMGITDYGDFIQTDASINRGNSGGPLIDLRGRVVGINTAIFSPNGGGSSGIGFAIPSEMARAVKDQLIASGHVRRGWLGVVMGQLSADLAASFDYTGEHGVLLDDVDPAGPGHAGGLRVGDIVARLDGEDVRDMADFRNTIAQAGPGGVVELSIWRGGQEHSVKVTLGTLPGSKPAPRPRAATTPTTEAPKPLALGLALTELSERQRRQLSLPEKGAAYVERVESDSLADEAGLRRGDVITKIAGREVRSAADADTTLAATDLSQGVRLRVRRGSFGRFVVLRRHDRTSAE